MMGRKPTDTQQERTRTTIWGSSSSAPKQSPTRCRNCNQPTKGFCRKCNGNYNIKTQGRTRK